MGLYIPDLRLPDDGDFELWIAVRKDGSFTYNVRGGWKDGKQKAVPVPAHGDLIDRREAIIDANERAYDFWLSDDEVNATIQFLKEQTTIIQASEEGEI